jgi:cytochrome oxidase Cu insertion factor (SCO1/SenC/PrrC family)
LTKPGYAILPITSRVRSSKSFRSRRGTLPAATLPLDKDGALHASPPAGNLPLYPEFALAASDGRDRRLADFRGLVVALSVGYTQCPDVCPTTLSELKAAVEGLSPAQRRRVQVLFATLDPDRDGLAMLKEYAAAFSPASGRPVLGLRGSTRATAALISQLQLVAERQPSGGAGVHRRPYGRGFPVRCQRSPARPGTLWAERRRVAPRPCPPAG